MNVRKLSCKQTEGAVSAYKKALKNVLENSWHFLVRTRWAFLLKMFKGWDGKTFLYT